MREIHGVVVTNRMDTYDTVTVEDGMEGKIYLNVGDSKYVKLTAQKAEFLAKHLTEAAVRSRASATKVSPVRGGGGCGGVSVELKSTKKKEAQA